MSDIVDLSNYDPNNIPEAEILEAGTEVNARVTGVNKGVNKNNEDYLMVWLEDSENPNVEDFSCYLPLPNDGATDKENRKRLRQLAAFSESFGLDIFGGEFDLETAVGETGWVIVGIGKDQDDNPCNTVRKFTTG